MFRNWRWPHGHQLACACLALAITSLALLPHTAQAKASQAAAATGNVYVVSIHGNDANPGTSTQPWRTIGKAANTLNPGDTVYILSGTYHERVVPRQSGSAGQLIVYAAYPGHYPVIDGSGGLVGNYQGLFDVSHKSNIAVTGLTLTNSGYAGFFAESASNIMIEKCYIANSGSSGIGIWGGSGIVAKANNVENSNYGGAHEAITFGGVTNFIISYNWVHNPNPTGGRSKEGIDAKQGSNNGLIFNNLVDHMQAVAIYVDAYDQHTFNISVNNNVVHDAPLGFVLASEAGGLLENVLHFNNVAYNIQYCGLRVFGKVDTDSHPMRNIALVNNTVYKSGCGIDVSNSQVQGFAVRNNLLSQNGSQLQINVPASLLAMDHNLIDGASSTLGSGAVQGNPRFQNPGVGNFGLLAGSPAVDRGSAAGVPGDDCVGVPRPQGAGIDIGAFELPH